MDTDKQFPDSEYVSKRTLKMIDESIKNLNEGKASKTINLAELTQLLKK